MNALRHFLLRSGVATRLLRGLVLAVLLPRALIPVAVMLDPNSSGAGAVVLCSGHGPLIIGAAARIAGLPDDSPITQSNAVAVRAGPLTHDGHGMSNDPSMSTDSSGGLCSFSAALFAALMSCLLLVPLFPAAARQVWARPAVRVAVRPTIGDRPPSRGPPWFG